MCYVITECSEYTNNKGEIYPMAHDICWFHDRYTAERVMECLQEKYPYREYDIAQMSQRAAENDNIPYCKVVMNREKLAL